MMYEDKYIYYVKRGEDRRINIYKANKKNWKPKK